MQQKTADHWLVFLTRLSSKAVERYYSIAAG
jgi:hypothetical protein